MRIVIAAIGRMKQGPERELVSRYLDRARATGRQLGLSGFDTIELPESRASSANARKAEEAKALRAALPENAILAVLDEHGKSLTSLKLSDTIATWRDNGKPALVCLIGGADGLDHDLIKSADLKIAFSEFTWPHQIVRIMLAEQLYRTTTILSGHPYHRGE